MKQSKAILLVGLVLSMAILACSIEDLGLPAAPVNDENLLFKDDFSDKTSGWITTQEPNVVMNYELGGFRIWVNQPNFDTWSVPGMRYSDVQIEVDAAKTGGPDDNDYGIICRYQDQNNFYGFLISSDGYYGITRRKDGAHQTINPSGMKAGEMIVRGAASNHIRADCIGSTLTMYINGQKVAEVQDSEIASGDVGLLAGSFDTGGVDILFNRFVVNKGPVQ